MGAGGADLHGKAAAWCPRNHGKPTSGGGSPAPRIHPCIPNAPRSINQDPPGRSNYCATITPQPSRRHSFVSNDETLDVWRCNSLVYITLLVISQAQPVRLSLQAVRTRTARRAVRLAARRRVLDVARVARRVHGLLAAPCALRGRLVADGARIRDARRRCGEARRAVRVAFHGEPLLAAAQLHRESMLQYLANVFEQALRV